MYKYASSYRLRTNNALTDTSRRDVDTRAADVVERVLPFSFTLPNDLPTSFDVGGSGAQLGSIRYFVKVGAHVYAYIWRTCRHTFTHHVVR
jgi:hypothetical protein